MRFLLTTLLLIFALAACSEASEGDDADATLDPETAAVTVAFRDSSVPPEYHRSWVLTLASDEIDVVVDSYGDIVSEGSEVMDEREWRDFVADLPDDIAGLAEPEAEEPGCVGGTGITLTVEGSWSTEVEVSSCASEANHELTGRIVELVRPFTDAVDLDDRLETDWPPAD